MKAFAHGVRLRVLVLAAVTAALAGTAAAEDKEPYKVVKLEQLIDAIKSHKGKVVVVDFWSDG